MLFSLHSHTVTMLVIIIRSEHLFIFCHFNIIITRLILTYLIPLKMMFGQMPRKELLENYNLLPFYDVAMTVR